MSQIRSLNKVNLLEPNRKSLHIRFNSKFGIMLLLSSASPVQSVPYPKVALIKDQFGINWIRSFKICPFLKIFYYLHIKHIQTCKLSRINDFSKLGIFLKNKQKNFCVFLCEILYSKTPSLQCLSLYNPTLLSYSFNVEYVVICVAATLDIVHCRAWKV